MVPEPWWPVPNGGRHRQRCGTPVARRMVTPGKVAERRAAKVAAIVEAAWKLAAEHGIAGILLHALAREVGMRQPSLYEYFDSKRCRSLATLVPR